MLTELLTNRTLPSVIRVLQPPEWLLVELTMWELSTPHPKQSCRHEFHVYCDEFGGTIVLNSVMPGVPHDQYWPAP
jgi:hypothetical protein